MRFFSAGSRMDNQELRLQPRLQCIADSVPPSARLVDVGTDHGYLPIWLLRYGRIEHAIASDINTAPLEHARRTAANYNISLDLRLCAGLDAVSPEEVDTVVVAGMGGETILNILQSAAWDWEGKTLLLQPMTKTALLRRALPACGLRIVAERLVRDREIIYAVLTVTAGKSSPPTNAEAWCGTGLEDDPLYGEYVDDRIQKLRQAAAGLRQARHPDRARIKLLEADAAALTRKKEEWERANGTGTGTRAV